MLGNIVLTWALFLPAILAIGLRQQYGVNEHMDACSSCTRAVKLLDNAFTDTNLEHLVAFIGQEVCPGVQSIQQCREKSAALLPVMMQWFKASATPAQLCSASEVCGNKLRNNRLHLHPLERLPRDGPTCAMCAFVVDRIKAALNDTAVQKTILEKALQACNTLPADLAKSCSDFVNTYEPQLAQFIENVDSSEICMLLGVCIADLVTSRPSPPALPIGLITPLAAAHGRLARVAGPANDACDVCKMSVIEVHALITNPAVQSNLVNYTKSLCSVFGGPFTAACEDYVDSYAPMVFTLLDKYLASPDDLCAQLGVCTPRVLTVLQQQGIALAAKFSNV